MKLLPLLFAAATLYGQGPPAHPPAAGDEQADLSRAVSEAGTSPVDFIRALEAHLKKYPESAQRSAIEKALSKSAIDANDSARIIRYGGKLLDSDPKSEDLQLYDRVTRELLASGDAESLKRALAYAKRYEAAVEAMRPRAAEGHMGPAAWAEEVDKGNARAMVLEARALGNLGDLENAAKTAKRAWDVCPGSEPAREAARWLEDLNRDTEALGYYANAFSTEDSGTNAADRARIRTHMGEIYTKLNGSEKGLGDLILRAWDRTNALRRERLAAMKSKDPNAGATEVMDFTLPKEGGGSLALASLRGKTVVMDFWATWCGPCRAQHPMIENVKKRFENADNVVFLSVDSDDDHSLVAPFINEVKWTDPVYYEAGLQRLLNISSIPTILVVNPAGKVSSRMNGFIAERFEDMLAERIEEARAN